MHMVWPRLLLQGFNLEFSLKDLGMIQTVVYCMASKSAFEWQIHQDNRHISWIALSTKPHKL
jgi:hypothetical protein